MALVHEAILNLQLSHYFCNHMQQFSGIPFVDFHTHRRTDEPDTLCVISMNGIPDRQADFFTTGYHPWWISDQLASDQLDVLQVQFTQNPGCLGLGECGLDALRGLDLDRQEENFILQLNVANRLGAPVVIHCVRAFDRLMRLAKIYKKTPWAVHGFVRNKVLARQLLDQGIKLSLAPCSKMATTFEEMLSYVPVRDIFIEKDSEQSLSIKHRYAIFAEIRNMDIEQLKIQMFGNFKIFFAAKWKYPDGLSGQSS